MNSLPVHPFCRVPGVTYSDATSVLYTARLVRRQPHQLFPSCRITPYPILKALLDKLLLGLGAVSYTHLDVYKRQDFISPFKLAVRFFEGIGGKNDMCSKVLSW